MTEPRLPPAAVEVADAPTPLDALQLPLWGSRLIEASAGTGKTWTIAALYLRLVLGHGAGDGDEASGHGRPLAPSEILVMTFTRAATRELSDRIRARLVEAAACFRGRQLPAAHDHFLAGLLAAYPEGPAREQAAWRLALAAEAMDDAAVHTIDAWCQRMLREHAFDSGSLFDEELQADEQALLAEACRDYWRQQIYPLGDGAILDAILSLWPHVQALQRSVQALLPHGVDGSQTMSAGSLADLVGPQVAELQALKQGWVDKAAALGAWLPGQLEGKQPALKKGSYPANQWPGWIKALDAWACTPAQVLPDLADKSWTALTLDGVDAARTDRSQPLDLPAAVAAALAELEALHPRLQALDQQPPLAGQLALHAAAQVAQRLAQFKRQRGSFGFADLQERLDAALAGPAGARLRQRIVQQTPVALVDEFQDTSPLQYRLFDRLYDTAANARGSALFLIGDPKQSIYAFRGADIHSYLAARQATRGRHYLLDTNYRSTTALVGAVNQLFGQAERGSTRGAFLFRAEATAVTAATAPEPAAVANPLPFLAVAAHGRSDRLVDAQGPLPALTVLADPRPATAAQIQRRYAVHCAEHIVALLNEPACGYEHDDGRPRRRLAPGDIAVLVRTGREARAVRRALAERQVASVYLSDQESVYASREAADLLLWLQAVADPLDARRARAALATATLDLPLAELARLSQDDLAFEAHVEQLRQLASVWRRQGVLPMLRRSLHLLRLPARWLARPDGERRITNLLHLAELLQAAAAQLDGEQALIRWLSTQLQAQAESGGRGGSDEQIVRLESDADLVQVITVHKSKGLEYPVVCLPFATSQRPVTRRGRQFIAVRDEAHDAASAAGADNTPDTGGSHALAGAAPPTQAGLPRGATSGRRLDFRLGDEAVAQAEDERLQEDLRLLYVALTRARHALWLGVGFPVAGKGKAPVLHLSALGQLLGHGEVLAPDHLMEHLATALAGTAGVQIINAAELPPDTASLGATRLLPLGDAPPLQPARPYRGGFARDWGIASFSGLVRELPGPQPAEATRHLLADAALHEELMAEAAELAVEGGGAGSGPEAGSARHLAVSGEAPPSAAELAPWHSFPRGALAGNFLHEQLEWLADKDFALADDPGLQQALLRRCERRGWGHRAEAVRDWLLALVATPLPGPDRPLAGLGTLLPEMEFWFACEASVGARDIDALCCRHILPGVERPALPERQLRGMLMGFADLVFESGGRYWVLDYKSNTLGEDDAAYGPAALAGAMAAHRYDVQAALYLLALHRLLRQRLGLAYDPARQLGGAVYLFMRGLRSPTAGCCVVHPEPALLDGLDALLAGRAGNAHAAGADVAP